MICFHDRIAEFEKEIDEACNFHKFFTNHNSWHNSNEMPFSMQSSQRPFRAQHLVRQRRNMHFDNYTDFGALCCCLPSTSGSDSMAATLMKHIRYCGLRKCLSRRMQRPPHLNSIDVRREQSQPAAMDADDQNQPFETDHLRRCGCPCPWKSMHEFEIKFYHLPTLSLPHAHILVVSFLHHYGVREEY